MKLIDYFSRVRIISLLSRSDRRAAITRELIKHGMTLELGKVDFFDAIRPNTAAGFPSIGLHGCFLSHLQILKEARAQALDRVLVLEDDLQLWKRFQAYVGPLLDQLCSQHWGIVYFGHSVKLNYLPSATLVSVPSTQRIMLTHFLGINGSLFDRLIDFFEGLRQRPPGHPEGGPMSIDGGFSTFRLQNPDVVTLLANPSLGWQRSSRTDAHPNKWFDRAPVIRDAVAWMRRGKSLLNSYRS
jgi:hypothetical protein